MIHSLARVFPALCLLALAACGGSSSPSGGEESTSGSEALGQTTAVGEIGAQHGATAYGVYLVVAAEGAPELAATAEDLEERHIIWSMGALGCEQGSAEALGVDPELHGVSVLFETREAAERFAATLTTPPVGIAQVTVYCAD